MKPRTLFLGTALAACVLVIITDCDNRPKSDIASATAPAGRSVNVKRTTLFKALEAPAVIALLPREDLIGEEAVHDEKQSLFSAQTWAPPPPPPAPPPVVQPAAPPPPPPAPVAPPLPFTFLGKQRVGVIWEVFLSDGQHTHVVRDQSVINDAYRVDTILPPTLTITYLPLNQAQTLAVGGFE